MKHIKSLFSKWLKRLDILVYIYHTKYNMVSGSFLFWWSTEIKGSRNRIQSMTRNEILTVKRGWLSNCLLVLLCICVTQWFLHFIRHLVVYLLPGYLEQPLCWVKAFYVAGRRQSIEIVINRNQSLIVIKRYWQSMTFELAEDITIHWQELITTCY